MTYSTIDNAQIILTIEQQKTVYKLDEYLNLAPIWSSEFTFKNLNFLFRPHIFLC